MWLAELWRYPVKSMGGEALQQAFVDHDGLLGATDGAIASLGYDRRRLRPKLLLGGGEGLAERGWEGRQLRVGAAVIRMVTLRQRCIMTTFDPDTAKQDVDVLLRIHRELDGVLALDSEVVRPGLVKLGDTVEIV